jgi:hypothetical protein
LSCGELTFGFVDRVTGLNELRFPVQLVKQVWRVHFAPSEQLRERLRTDPRRWVLAIAALQGIGLSVHAGRWRESNFVGAFALASLALIAFTPFLGVVLLYVKGASASLAGRLFGGRASDAELRAAVAWGSVPLLLPLTLSLPLELLLWRHRLGMDGNPLESLLRDLLGATVPTWVRVGSVVSIFTISSCIAEAQGFGKWRAVATEIVALLLPALVLVVAVFFVAFIRGEAR